jgi:hypothetical protein
VIERGRSRTLCEGREVERLFFAAADVCRPPTSATKAAAASFHAAQQHPESKEERSQPLEGSR